jgi:uncharacterized protein
MTYYLFIFLAGLAGSMHCIGMCGGFACAMGGDPRGRAPSVLRHGVYNLGRVSSYCFIGAAAGYGGMLLVGHGGETTAGSAAQRALALLSGLLMVFIGLQFFGLFKRAGLHLLEPGGHALAQALRRLVKAPGMAAPLAFGVLNGLLPCPLVYAFAAQAAASGGPLQGLLIMAAFGLGTFPAMLMMGGVGLWLRRGSAPAGTQTIRASFLPRAVPVLRTEWRLHGMRSIAWRTQGVRVAGGFIVLLGVITLARGLLPMSGHMLGH